MSYGKSNSRFAPALAVCAVATLVALTGCGGGGGGGGGGNGSNPPGAPPRAPLALVFFEDRSAAGAADPSDAALRLPLWSVLDDGAGLVELVPDDGIIETNVVDWALSPDRQWMALRADYEVDQKFELFVVPIDGGTPVKVNGNMPANRDVFDFQWSPDSKRLVYWADQDIDQVTEIYLVEHSGANRVKINNPIGLLPTVEYEQPVWSPDGRYIGYRVRDLATGRYIGIDIHDTTLGTPNSTRVTPAVATNRSIIGPMWSPASTRFSYLEYQGNDGSMSLGPNTRFLFVCTIGVSCARVTVAGFDSAGGFKPKQFWSPDGSRLAYAAEASITNPPTQLFVDALDGQPSIQVNEMLPAGSEVLEDSPTWSPDGSRLAYAVTRELHVWSRSSGTNRMINTPLEPTGHLDLPQWSPDGSRIAFRARNNNTLPLSLFVNRLDSPDVTQIAGFENPERFGWSPDGTAIAAIGEPTGSSANELFVAGADATDAVKVNGTLPDFGTGLTPVVHEFAWAPDSARIVYLGGTMLPLISLQAENLGLYSVDRSDGSVIRLGGDVKASTFSY